MQGDDASTAGARPEVSFRGRILYPWKGGYETRTLLELDMRAAIGAVLNKREWWIKWRSRDADGVFIRDKWLAEFERTLITDMFTRETLGWRPWWLERAIPHMYHGFPVDGSDTDKRAFVDKACLTIPYNLIWHRDECKRLDQGVDAAVVAAMRAEPLDAFRQGNESMQSWGQITWYFELVLLHKTLRALPVSAWQPPQCVRVGSKQAVARATQLMLAVRRGDITRDTFAAHAPDGDHSSVVVDALWVHVDRIMKELDEIRGCIARTLDKEVEGSKLNVDDVSEYTSPGPVQETWFSDYTIPLGLKHKFIKEVAALENVPEEQKDWHPESNSQVLDLLHPSLYCCVFGKTKRVAEPTTTTTEDAPAVAASVLERTQRMLFSGAQLVENPHRGEAQYQWIPSDVAVDEDGGVKILSYINNLDPEKHAGLYDSISRIFYLFGDMFDAVLSCLRNPEGPYLEMDYERAYNQNEFIPVHPSVPETLRLHTPRTPYSLCGQMVQIIVKIAEIHLTPENPTYPGGAWHVEGSDAEQIVATGIYYFGCTNITESKLSFRVIVKEPEHHQDDTLGMRAMYGLARDERLVQSLGAITALEDRCVVFPNTLQHRVEPFELADKSRPGVRKILAFFLVDPTKPIPSTAVIPPQQAEWIREGVASMVVAPLQNLGVAPDSVVRETVEAMLGTSHAMTLEETKRHRLALMAERTPTAEQESDHELFFSLCEH